MNESHLHEGNPSFPPCVIPVTRYGHNHNSKTRKAQHDDVESANLVIRIMRHVRSMQCSAVREDDPDNNRPVRGKDKYLSSQKFGSQVSLESPPSSSVTILSPPEVSQNYKETTRARTEFELRRGQARSMHSLGRSSPTTRRHPLLLPFSLLVLFFLNTAHAAVLPTAPTTQLERFQDSAFNLNTSSASLSPQLQIHAGHHDDEIIGTKQNNHDNKMTKQSLLDLVTTNLGINLHTSTSQSHDSLTYGDPQPKFHISSRDHFLHPLPGTYPRMTRLSDGSILFSFTHFGEPLSPGGPPQRSLKIARSLDDGKTFTPHGEVTTSLGDLDNLFLLQLPWTVPVEQGRVQPILGAFRHHDVAPDGKYTYHRITVCQSLDNGRKWEFLSQAAESTPPRGLWEPFMRMSKHSKNEIQLFYSGELKGDDQDTFLTVSRDGGKSWSKPRPVTGVVGQTALLGAQGQGQQQDWHGMLRDGMIGIAETKDTQGREVLVMVLETTRAGGYMVVECLLSYDDGLTWGFRQSVYVPPAPKGGRRRNAGSPQVISFGNGDGEIAVVFMTDEDDEGNTCRWPRGAKVKVLFGARPDEQGRIAWRGGGRPRDVSSSSTGTVLADIKKNGRGTASAPGRDTSSSWPGVLKLDEERVLVVYETAGIIKGRVITQNSS
ncbi:Sialidase [Naviculisporaceae sp. PSN 640]